MASNGVTPDDLFDCADACLAVAIATQTYRHKNQANLPSKDVVDLAQFEADLVSVSSTLRTVAVGVALAESKEAADALKDATQRAKDAAKTIKNVKSAIAIAGTLLTLAAAAASQNPIALISAAAELKKLVDAAVV